jgi:hypothetical protein
MIHEHDRVILRTNLPEHALLAGDMGTVVHIYTDGLAYEVEFFTVDGQTLDVVTVEASQVRPVDSHAILHARQIAV